jgi:hypothetical protein
VRQGAAYTAEGYDLDPEPLEWGRENNLVPLGDDARRVELVQADVREPGRTPPDVRAAQNFSYWTFKERAVLLDYFKKARASLAPGGLFVIDLYGGDEGTVVLDERRKIEGGFTYVWDQARYLPGNGAYTCHIHFHFKDGSKLKRAFSYEWRFWSMPELKDILRDAGFTSIDAYFEGSDDGDEGNGEFALDPTGETAQECAGWVAYLVAYD